MRNSPPGNENPLLPPSAGTLTHKQAVLRVLMARFGSRRAIIEEVDRLKRLQLLTPPAEGVQDVGSKVGYPRIKNEPNPEWREIDTPSLLISGEIIPVTPVLHSATPPKPTKKVPKRKISTKNVKTRKNGPKR